MKIIKSFREVEVKEILRSKGFEMISIRNGMVKAYKGQVRYILICDIETSTNEEILEGLENDEKE